MPPCCNDYAELRADEMELNGDEIVLDNKLLINLENEGHNEENICIYCKTLIAERIIELADYYVEGMRSLLIK